MLFSSLFIKCFTTAKWFKWLDLIFERMEFQVFESAIAKDRPSFQAKKRLGAIVLRCGLERALESRRASF